MNNRVDACKCKCQGDWRWNKLFSLSNCERKVILFWNNTDNSWGQSKVGQMRGVLS